MILEVVTVRIRAGMGAEYVRVFREMAHLIESSEGYISHQLLRCQEAADKFIVLVQWQRLEDHTKGFGGSPQYQLWKERIHPLYAALSTVEHFASPD